MMDFQKRVPSQDRSGAVRCRTLVKACTEVSMDPRSIGAPTVAPKESQIKMVGQEPHRVRCCDFSRGHVLPFFVHPATLSHLRVVEFPRFPT
jgi:hypothetical protein